MNSSELKNYIQNYIKEKANDRLIRIIYSIVRAEESMNLGAPDYQYEDLKEKKEKFLDENRFKWDEIGEELNKKFDV